MSVAVPEADETVVLDIDLELPPMCAMTIDGAPCNNVATWRHIVHCPKCNVRSPVLCCDRCHDLCMKVRDKICRCDECGHYSTYGKFHVQMEKL